MMTASGATPRRSSSWVAKVGIDASCGKRSRARACMSVTGSHPPTSSTSGICTSRPIWLSMLLPRPIRPIRTRVSLIAVPLPDVPEPAAGTREASVPHGGVGLAGRASGPPDGRKGIRPGEEGEWRTEGDTAPPPENPISSPGTCVTRHACTSPVNTGRKTSAGGIRA